MGRSGPQSGRDRRGESGSGYRPIMAVEVARRPDGWSRFGLDESHILTITYVMISGDKTAGASVRTRRKATSAAFRVRLRRARETSGWSQTDLAKRAGLQQSALSHYESGARRPSFTNLKRLAKALDVSTDYLVGHDAVVEKSPKDLARQIERLTPRDRELVRGLVESLLKGRR